jgi:hypothetical protein
MVDFAHSELSRMRENITRSPSHLINLLQKEENVGVFVEGNKLVFPSSHDSLWYAQNEIFTIRELHDKAMKLYERQRA